MELVKVTTAEYLPLSRQLFLEYATSLNCDLSFQNFEAELKNLPGKYAPPTGCLLLAFTPAQAAGCVALRQIGPEICELKRLYVRPEYRGQGIGKSLAQELIKEAGRLQYQKMRLDTLTSLKAALELYYNLGFYEIAPYCDNPLTGAIFLELALDKIQY